MKSSKNILFVYIFINIFSSNIFSMEEHPYLRTMDSTGRLGILYDTAKILGSRAHEIGKSVYDSYQAKQAEQAEQRQHKLNLQLHEAVHAKDSQKVQEALEQGADPNSIITRGSIQYLGQPLHSSIMLQDTASAQLLLEHGAATHHRSGVFNETPLEITQHLASLNPDISKKMTALIDGYMHPELNITRINREWHEQN